MLNFPKLKVPCFVRPTIQTLKTFKLQGKRQQILTFEKPTISVGKWLKRWSDDKKMLSFSVSTTTIKNWSPIGCIDAFLLCLVSCCGVLVHYTHHCWNKYQSRYLFLPPSLVILGDLTQPLADWTQTVFMLGWKLLVKDWKASSTPASTLWHTSLGQLPWNDDDVGCLIRWTSITLIYQVFDGVSSS